MGQSEDRGFEILGKKWAVSVISTLADGPLGFNRLKDALPGVSAKILSGLLREMGAAGLLVREVSDESPVRVTYALSKLGRDALPVLKVVREWGQRLRRPRAAALHSGT